MEPPIRCARRASDIGYLERILTPYTIHVGVNPYTDNFTAKTTALLAHAHAKGTRPLFPLPPRPGYEARAVQEPSSADLQSTSEGLTTPSSKTPSRGARAGRKRIDDIQDELTMCSSDSGSVSSDSLSEEES